ncbi:MAG: hypothetical protein AAB110_00315 [Candidatus Desantisbacteria bacterium]
MSIRQQYSRGRHKSTVVWLLLSLICLSGCAHINGGITYFDSTTYKNLTDLKPEVMALYDTFGMDTIDNSKISAVNLKLAQMYEYEKGKGEWNKETYKLIERIQILFKRHIDNRLQSGAWSTVHANNQKETIAEAFKLSIETEALKNKNESGGGK